MAVVTCMCSVDISTRDSPWCILFVWRAQLTSTWLLFVCERESVSSVGAFLSKVERNSQKLCVISLVGYHLTTL